MEINTKSLPSRPVPKPLTPEQAEIAGRAVGTYLQSVWDANGKGREVMERILAEEVKLPKAA